MSEEFKALNRVLEEREEAVIEAAMEYWKLRQYPYTFELAQQVEERLHAACSALESARQR